ncbi:MAG: hypothetical protein HFH86_04530 [Bacilli bacterium]|nr:hypothetical protein [Bacilli bacterium]
MKKIRFLLVLLVLLGIEVMPVYATSNSLDEMIALGDEMGDESNNTIYSSPCSNPHFLKPFRFLGRIFMVIKIVVPILLIVFGVWDFSKAVIGSKDDEMKKAIRTLMFRAISGVVIFFLPTLIHLVFQLVDGFNPYESDYQKCSLCITSPNKC